MNLLIRLQNIPIFILNKALLKALFNTACPNSSPTIKPQGCMLYEVGSTDGLISELAYSKSVQLSIPTL